MICAYESISAQRIRLDCDREASHNLNRLLDEPGVAAVNLLVSRFSKRACEKTQLRKKMGFSFTTLQVRLGVLDAMNVVVFVGIVTLCFGIVDANPYCEKNQSNTSKNNNYAHPNEPGS